MAWRRVFFSCLLLTACTSVQVPADFAYREIETKDFLLASWQKISDRAAPYRIYIEGDGYAFLRSGRPSSDPTPRGTLVRDLAFGDQSPNVVYLARPCQYVMSPICSQRYWTTARFAPEVVRAEAEAVRKITRHADVELIGFSGGAQIAGLIAVTAPDIRIRHITTVAGNLDHEAWTRYHDLPPLNESMSLEAYRSEFLEIPQHHYVGERDDVIAPFLVEEFVGNIAPVTLIKGADHNGGWQKAYPLIYENK